MRNKIIVYIILRLAYHYRSLCSGLVYSLAIYRLNQIKPLITVINMVRFVLMMLLAGFVKCSMYFCPPFVPRRRKPLLLPILEAIELT